MKKKKFLSAIVIGALAGAITAGANSAALAIDTYTLDGNTLYYKGEANCNNDQELKVYLGDTSSYTEDNWMIYDDSLVNVKSGGTLTVSNYDGQYHDDKLYLNGTVYGDNGTINVNSGHLFIGTSTDSGLSSYINSEVGLNLKAGSTLKIGPGGTVTINNNDSINNTAKLNMTGGTLTLNGGTHVPNSISITDGNLNIKSGILTLSNNSVIASDAVVNLESKLNIISTGDAGVTIDAGDTWKGGIDLYGGSLTILGDKVKEGKLDAEAGNLIIGNNDTTTSDVLYINYYNDGSDQDIIKENATVTIHKDGKLNQSKGLVTLNDSGTGADTWNGGVALSDEGNLILKNRTDITDVNTTTGANKTYTQSGGTLTLDKSNLSLSDTTTSKITGGKVNLNNGSTLVFNNGTTNANEAVIVSDSTYTGNSLTVGGDNGAKLTLTPSDSYIRKRTAITVTDTGELTTYGRDIAGGTESVAITNNGIFTLSDYYNTASDTNIEGTLTRVLSGTGTVNLLGVTETTSSNSEFNTIDATITQNIVNVGDALSTVSTFTMGADVTANEKLTVYENGTIKNGESTNIIAKTIDVAAGGKITGISDDTTTTYGNLTINNGGVNAGIIEQNEVTLNVDDTATPLATLDNKGTLSANGEFKNHIEITDTEATGKLNIYNGGSSDANITQSEIVVAKSTPETTFTNNANLTATKSLTNSSTINNNSNIKVQDENSQSATYQKANLLNVGVINNIATTVGDVTTPATITADTLTNHVEVETPEGTIITNGTINLTNSNLAVAYQDTDIKGIINALGTSAETDVSELSIEGENPNFAGTLNIGDAADTNVKSALALTSGNVVEDAIVNIATGNAMNISGANASLVLDSGASTAEVQRAADVLAGDLNLTAGNVEMKNLTGNSALTTGNVSTTDPNYEGTLPYYEQTGGKLTLTNSTLSMVDSSLISNPNGTTDLTIDAKSTFNSGSNAFEVQNLTTAGTINGINGDYENYAVHSAFNVGDEANADNRADFTVDLYARSKSHNNFHYDTYGSEDDTHISNISAVFDSDGDSKKDGELRVSDWKLNGDLYGWDAPIDRSFSMDKLFKGEVNVDDNINFTATDKEVFTPIGWYGLHSAGDGNYKFSLNRFNPGVFRGQVTKVAQYQNQLMIGDMLFNHAMLDQGFKGNDYVATIPNRLASAGDLFPPYQYSRKDGGLWVKMYGTFEKLNMNRGLNVGNNAYGTIIGADFGLKELRHGWQFMPTAYIAYNGAHQYWKGYGAYQNGGQLGVMGTWYKDNFMIGALAYGGVYNNDMDTPRGNDDTLGYFGGGAVKTAYNWRFARDWALQPNLLVAYNFFGKENWHSDFGQMGMMSGMLNGVNIAPGVNLIWEKETFSIYGTLQYMYNINQSIGGRAGNVILPHVHMDRGYIQYGLGFNKRFGDRFSGFLQAVIRNVGRTGVGLQAGFHWQLGKGGNGKIKGHTPELKKADIRIDSTKI